MLNNKKKVILSSLSVLAVGLVPLSQFSTTEKASAETTTFQVNVKESLSVSVTAPTSAQVGNAGDFLRNKVSVNVVSNNASGFKASMYANDTSLANTNVASATIPTLASSSVKSSFPANRWGYSLGVTSYNSINYGETDAGNNSSNYYPLTGSASPITLLSENAAATGSRDVYFGAKADMTQAAGTYVGTVVISVVTGTINENSGNTDYNPTTPTDPATPNPSSEATYDASGVGISTVTGDSPSTSGATRYSGTTRYTTITTNSGDTTTTTTTQVSGGDNRSTYSSPQGVTNRSTTEVYSNSSLSTTLAATAAVAATSGIVFFIIAKRRDDDDDEEEES